MLRFTILRPVFCKLLFQAIHLCSSSTNSKLETNQPFSKTMGDNTFGNLRSIYNCRPHCSMSNKMKGFAHDSRDQRNKNSVEGWNLHGWTDRNEESWIISRLLSRFLAHLTRKNAKSPPLRSICLLSSQYLLLESAGKKHPNAWSCLFLFIPHKDTPVGIEARSVHK